MKRKKEMSKVSAKKTLAISLSLLFFTRFHSTPTLIFPSKEFFNVKNFCNFYVRIFGWKIKENEDKVGRRSTICVGSSDVFLVDAENLTNIILNRVGQITRAFCLKGMLNNT
jgi:hypothetical protein